MILRTSFPSDDFHFTQYRVWWRNEVEHRGISDGADLSRRLDIQVLCSLLVLLPRCDVDHGDSNVLNHSLETSRDRLSQGVTVSRVMSHKPIPEIRATSVDIRRTIQLVPQSLRLSKKWLPSSPNVRTAISSLSSLVLC